MATVLGSRIHTDEAAKLASFKQRRLEKKIADRERLEAEFPLIFGNKQKLAATSSLNKYTTKIGASTPNKRKLSTINDENSINAVNSARKPSNIPISSVKKAAKPHTVFSSTLPYPPSKRSAHAQEFSKTLEFSITSKALAQTSLPVEEAHPLAISTNHPEPRVKSTSRDIEMVTLGESVAVVFEEVVVEDVVEAVTSFDDTLTPASVEDEPVEEKVQDVLDYLLECDEVDEPTHRRLSKQSFPARELRRLSVGTTKRVSFATCFVPVPASPVSPNVSSENMTCAGPVDEAMQISSIPSEGVTGDYIGEIDALYTAPLTEEPDIGDMDILFALRNYLSTEYTSLEETLHPSSLRRSSARMGHRFSSEHANETGLQLVEEDAEEEEEEGIVTKQVSFATSEAVQTEDKARSVAMITYPRTETLQHALLEGLVSVQVIGYLPPSDQQTHVQYMLNVAIPASSCSLPASTEAVSGGQQEEAGQIFFPSMKMFLLKRFSEFKEFRQELCSTVADTHHYLDHYHNNTTEAEEEVLEVIPSLKSRSSAAFLHKQVQEEDIYAARQTLLSSWFATILSNKKMMQNPEYRMKIQEFFSC